MFDPDFDPHAPLIAADGLEYENLAAYLVGNPVECQRNAVIRFLGHRRRSNPQEYEALVYNVYAHRTRIYAIHAGFTDHARGRAAIDAVRRGTSRVGLPYPGQAPADPVHPAD